MSELAQVQRDAERVNKGYDKYRIEVQRSS
jgi:hypothetical protein